MFDDTPQKQGIRTPERRSPECYGVAMAAGGDSAGTEGELDLEIRQNARFQQREWRLERVGWLLMAVFILAGLIGILGPGPLSWATADSEAGTFQVEYQRVGHNEADDSVRFLFSEDAIEDGKVTLELTGSWVSGIDVSGISPEPSAQYAIPDGIALDFDVLQPGDISVALTFRAQDYWMLDAEATVGEDSTSFTQLVLP